MSQIETTYTHEIDILIDVDIEKVVIDRKIINVQVFVNDICPSHSSYKNVVLYSRLGTK